MHMFRGSDLALDLGTSKFSICVRGEGLVVSEAPYIAFRGQTPNRASIVAIGDDAKALLGKVPRGTIQVLSPMQDGVIVDSHQAGIILQHLADKAGIRWRRGRSATLVTALLGASPLERKAFGDVAESLGRSRIVILDEPLAAANALDVDLSEPYAQLIIDIGEGASEALVVSMGQKVIGSSIRIGGQAMDHAIQDYSRRVHHLILAKDYACQLKESMPNSDSFSLRGMDRASQIPGFRTCTREDLEQVIQDVFAPIVQMVRDILSVLPPDMAVDLIENGIHLCGGAARSFGLREAIALATDLDVHLIDQPEAAVIRGCGRILNYVDYVS